MLMWLNKVVDVILILCDRLLFVVGSILGSLWGIVYWVKGWFFGMLLLKIVIWIFFDMGFLEGSFRLVVGIFVEWMVGCRIFNLGICCNVWIFVKRVMLFVCFIGVLSLRKYRFLVKKCWLSFILIFLFFRYVMNVWSMFCFSLLVCNMVFSVICFFLGSDFLILVCGIGVEIFLIEMSVFVLFLFVC